MNRTPRNINGGTRTIARKEWERKQAAAAAKLAATVKSKNAAAMAAMAGKVSK